MRIAIVGVPFLRQPGAFAGASVAGVRWVQALLEGGIHCDFYVQGSSVESARSGADAMYRGRGSYRVVAFEELAGELRRDAYFAVHDPEGLNRVDALLALARRLRATAAVTAAQYGVAFPQVQAACVRLAALPALDGWGVLCLSSASMEAQRRMFGRWGVSGGRLAIVPGCVNVKELHRTDRRAARAQYGVANDEVVVLYVGRLTPYDKADFGALLWLAREVQRRKGSMVKFIVGGNDPFGYSSELRESAIAMGVSVKIVANLTWEELVRLYSCADVFVSLADSIQESFGLTVAEAGACELAVVATDWDGYKDIVVDGETGYLIPTEWRAASEGPSVIAALGDVLGALREWRRSVVIDRAVLVQRVVELVENSELRHRLGRAARERVCARFSQAKVRESTVRAWEAMRRDVKAQDGDVGGIQSPLEVDANMFAHYATRSEERGDLSRQRLVGAEPEA